ncbi:hypothetical protein SHKM778_88360 [Streptomyces sp. KM77-8]|uniref:Uncharacterized protein n=1 Tax=Streptomyces haneummycinicus TaxID=3074435 RepID=A0AAT9HYI0_9ACTN
MRGRQRGSGGLTAVRAVRVGGAVRAVAGAVRVAAVSGVGRVRAVPGALRGQRAGALPSLAPRAPGGRLGAPHWPSDGGCAVGQPCPGGGVASCCPGPHPVSQVWPPDGAEAG